jgi:hypothetical protein
MPADEPAPTAEAQTEVIEARADRVRALIEANFGSVLERNGDVMLIEVPADISLPIAGLIWIGGRSGTAKRRIKAMNGTFVELPEEETMSFWRYRIDLAGGP